MAQQDESPWWAAFPEPKADSDRIEQSEVVELLKNASSTSKTFLLVDVRRTDWEGGTISTSINFPAQTFYQTRDAVYQLCKRAGIEKIIFYCGSSNGRGPRCANWMQDLLNEIGESDIKALILTGGIKGWQKSYGGQWMDWYDEKYWTEQAK